jgi:hypothetical protein
LKDAAYLVTGVASLAAPSPSSNCWTPASAFERWLSAEAPGLNGFAIWAPKSSLAGFQTPRP